MLKNYLKIAFRNLRKNPGYSSINIIGLGIGLSCFIIIMAYIRYEVNFDQFHEKADRTYRVAVQQPENLHLGTNHFAITPAPLENAIVNDFPEVETATTIAKSSLHLSVEDQAFNENGIIASPSFFNVFTFPLLEGDPQTALTSPNSIVLTKALANKMFGDEAPMGRTITRKDGIEFTVTGIIEKVPENSHVFFDFITPASSNERYAQNVEEWRNSGWFTYIVLKEGTNATHLQAKFPEFIAKYSSTNHRYYLQPLTDIHLRSDINFELSSNNNIIYIYLFAGIAILVLLLAAINYMNLAVAQSIKRAKEVGLRKVIGAHRGQLIAQFLSESMLSAFLALLVALVLSDLALPIFDELVERPLSLAFLKDPTYLALILGSTLISGLIAGSYPAFFITRLQPNKALKGMQKKGSDHFNLRNVLIVGQFAASIILVVGSIVIYQQMQYVQTTDMGYDREHILTLSIQDQQIDQKIDLIRQELLQHPGIDEVSASFQLPNSIDAQTVIQGWEGSADSEQEQPIYITGADYNYIDLYDMEILSGRNFSKDISSDTTSGTYLINETAAKSLGWGIDSAVGKSISAWGGKGTVVGVVKDFHMHSLHMQIEPLTIFLEPNQFDFISLKLQPNNLSETVNHVTKTLTNFSGYPVSYSFLDDVFDDQYKSENKLNEIVTYFTLLALFIAAIGLFGLAAYSAEQRTKEIGIRKVLGASVANIIALLSSDFIKLVIIGFVIAIPLAWYAMIQWLADFAYRIEIGPGIFVLAGSAALIIALLTVSWQSIKAAIANPVNSLKSE
ncbi:MAG: ABC transporter permease [Balneolaceae bacterium]